MYLLLSLRYGPRAGANPWNATGLEWQTSSPPPPHNFLETPIVTEEPYQLLRQRQDRGGRDGTMAHA